nr:hypothetical protein [Tanacetum cinerariifolium]
MNGLSVVSEITNQYGNRNVVTAPVEGNGNGINGNPIRCYNCRGGGHYASNYIVKPRKQDAAYLQHQLQMAQEEEAEIQSTQEEFDFMAAADAYEDIKKVTANCNLAEYIELLEPIPKPHKVPQNDSNVISEVSSVEQGGKTVEQHSANVEKTAAKFVQDFKSLAKEADESLANNKALELEIERLLRAVKLENENVELEFQVLNYAKENAHLKTTHKNLFDSISMTRAQTKTIIDSLQTKLHNMIYENAKLRGQLFDKVSGQNNTTCGTSANTKFANQSMLGKPPSPSRHKLYAVTPLPKSTVFPKVGETNALSNQVTSNSVPSSQEPNVVKNDNVISL